MTEDEAVRKARAYFLEHDNTYGCAETVFMVLKKAYSLPDPHDSAAAMALNGGVAYGGGVCGAITGAGLAVGMLAKECIADHKTAKRTSRRILMRTMDQFERDYKTVDCRDLIGLDIRQEDQHHQFVESGIWQTTCIGQIEFVVRQLVALRDEDVWGLVLSQMEP